MRAGTLVGCRRSSSISPNISLRVKKNSLSICSWGQMVVPSWSLGQWWCTNVCVCVYVQFVTVWTWVCCLASWVCVSGAWWGLLDSQEEHCSSASFLLCKFSRMPEDTWSTKGESFSHPEQPRKLYLQPVRVYNDRVSSPLNNAPHCEYFNKSIYYSSVVHSLFSAVQT